MRRDFLWLCTPAIALALTSVRTWAASASEPVDARDIRTGWEIPTSTYSDQPYIVKTNDGA